MVERNLAKVDVAGSNPVSRLSEGISYGASYQETSDITYMPELILDNFQFQKIKKLSRVKFVLRFTQDSTDDPE